VRLFLNDSLVDERPAGYVQQFKAVFTLPYQAGTLRAVGVDENGIEQETVVLKTSGTPVSLRLTTQDQTIRLTDKIWLLLSLRSWTKMET
jgi:beta-galactosidase